MRVMVGVACVLLLGCAGIAPSTAEPATTNKAGGTLRIGLVHLWEDFLLTTDAGSRLDTTLDPQTPFQQGELFRCCLLRTLLSYDGTPGAEGGTKLQPDLATAFPDVSDDGLVWTFHLRRGVHYAPPLQQSEITATDFIRALERELTPTPATLTSTFSNLGPHLGNAYYVFTDLVTGAQAFADGTASSIAGLEAPDPYTLRVQTTKPSGDLPYFFALPNTAPLPANPYAPTDLLGVAQGHDASRGPFLVSSGPYMLEGADKLDFSKAPGEQLPVSGYKPGEGFNFVRNPSWDPATDPLRKAYPDRIEFTTWPSDDAAVAATEAGTIDMAWDALSSSTQVAKYANDDPTHGHLITAANDVVLIVFFNVAARPFDDVHVRRALNLVLDKARIHEQASSLRAGFAGPTGGQVAGHIVVDGLEDYLLAGYRPYDAPTDHGDLAAAKAEMALSPYDTNHDGLCDAPQCASVRVLVRDSEPFWPAAAQVIADGAGQIGVHLDLQIVPAQDMFAAWFDPSARLPMAIGARFTKDYPTAAGVLPSLFSSEAFAAEGSASNIGATPEQLRSWGYDVTSVPSVDDRIDACRADIRAPTECWARLDQYMMEEVVPALPLIFGSSAWITSNRVDETSFAQAFSWPALDRFVISPSAR